MKRLTIGILAHVDAGKTTLAESILYKTETIRKFGRVDHKNTFLDTYELERARGITIFAKQARFVYKDMEVTLLDTPGHVDFSAEMERTLQVLDYAILVINGSDGVQSHTETLWRLLSKYQVPTILFINKMDIEGNEQSNLMEELKKNLSDGCINFTNTSNQSEFYEQIALCDENLLEYFLETGTIEKNLLLELLNERKLFPSYFGSALKQEGIMEFLEGIHRYTLNKRYPETFGAKVFKIVRDEQGNRLTYMKITGGTLKVKKTLSYEGTITKDSLFSLSNETKEDSDTYNSLVCYEEKIENIRLYSGTKFDSIDTAEAGMICAVVGLSKTYPGQGLGIEKDSFHPILEAVLTYRIIPSSDIDPILLVQKLRILEEEDPKLHVMWKEELKEVHLQLMGEIQVDIVKNMMKERFGMNISFGQGAIVYKESILEPVIGIGHFEPLRHYAEVQLLLEPAPKGSGILIDSRCREDLLSVNWQKSILGHIAEKEHLGVLTGFPITDIKITLMNGKAHLKHTTGGDFREATYRAIRHGLKRGKSVLLEPYYEFRIELPIENLGRAMSDLTRLKGNFSQPDTYKDMSYLIGEVPVSTFRGYATELTAYTKGRGKLTYNLKHYDRCHNETEVIQSIGYDSELDLYHPTSSVFCAHGAGFIVPWEDVESYAHLTIGIDGKEKDESQKNTYIPKIRSGNTSSNLTITEDEITEIFNSSYRTVKKEVTTYGKKTADIKKLYQAEYIRPRNNNKRENMKTYLLVDGYNIIFAWDELNELSKINMDSARNKLMDILCNYQGYTKDTVILVFDAYKVKGNLGSITTYHNINVVYTKEAETADIYIEKTTNDLTKNHKVVVATSDGLEQMIIMGFGASRMSAKELQHTIAHMEREMNEDFLERNEIKKHSIGEELAGKLEEVKKIIKE